MTKKRIVLVTGAARGLGAEVAARLAEQAALVLLGGRKLAALEPQVEAILKNGGEAQALELDVTEARSIAAAVRSVEERYARLDVLVNNAGVMLDGAWVGNTAADVSAEVLRATFDTNFFGAVAVTQAFLPLLRRGSEPHVVNVSSIMGSTAIHADLAGPLSYTKPFAYDASKAALNSFTVHLAAALQKQGIRVNSVHPGWVRTGLGTDAATLSVAEGARPIVELVSSRAPLQTAKFLELGGELPW